MTLATVPRYDREAVPVVGDHAVVVGGSMAGLFTARVLADGFETVTIIEKDTLSNEPTARRGVPQSSHVHAMQEAGRATLEDLFPRVRRGPRYGRGAGGRCSEGLQLLRRGRFPRRRSEPVTSLQYYSIASRTRGSRARR